ncbi:MAG: hypothetical protein WCG47_31660 [Dermatophilaceae bacterium]
MLADRGDERERAVDAFAVDATTASPTCTSAAAAGVPDATDRTAAAARCEPPSVTVVSSEETPR